MEEPDWAQILTAIYRSGRQIDAPHDLENLPEDHILIQRTDIPSDEVRDALVFLRQQELIEMELSQIEVVAEETNDESDYRGRIIKLNPRGFDVAHDRELSMETHAGNYAIAALTAVLGLTALVRATIAFASEDLSLLSVTVIGILLITTVGIFFAVWNQLQRAGALDIQKLVDRRKRHE